MGATLEGSAALLANAGFVAAPGALSLRVRRRALALAPARRRCWARAASRAPRAIFVWSAGDALFRDDDDDDEEDDDAKSAGGAGGEDGDALDDDASAAGGPHSDGFDSRTLEERLFGSLPGGGSAGDDGLLGGADDRDALGGFAGSERSPMFASAGQRRNDAGAGRNVLYDALREYSSGPEDLSRMKADASEAANDAFKRTVLGIVGALPSDSYEVTITSDRSGLARLMHSSLCTGYALRNAEFRLALNDSLTDALSSSRPSGTISKPLNSKPTAPKRGRPSKKSTGRSASETTNSGRNGRDAAPDVSGSDAKARAVGSRGSHFDSSSAVPESGSGLTSRRPEQDADEPEYMRNVPFRGKVDSSNIEGSVKWWDHGLESKQEMNAVDYVARLESENELLRDRLQAKDSHSDHASNRILDFMKTLSTEKIAALQRDISSLSEDAFRLVLVSVLGEFNSSRLQTTYSTNRDYMAQVTLWCLLGGYTLRNLEKKNEMQTLFSGTHPVNSRVSHAQSPPSPPSSSAQPPPQTPPSL